MRSERDHDRLHKRDQISFSHEFNLAPNIRSTWETSRFYAKHTAGWPLNEVGASQCRQQIGLRAWKIRKTI